MTKLKVIALANNSCETDARIIRSAEAAAAAGHDVVVLCRASSTAPAFDTINGVVYERSGSPKKGTSNSGSAAKSRISMLFRHLQKPIKWGAERLITRTLYLLAVNCQRYAVRGIAYGPDIVHAHDLYTLLAGWIISRKSGARLIYDSHEIELGRNGKFSAHELRVIAFAERFLIKRADAVVTVSDACADFLQDHYAIPRPTVVLNAPKIGQLLENPIRIREILNVKADEHLAVFVGGVTFNRGLENIVRAMPLVPNVHIAMIGPRNERSESELAALARKLNVQQRFHFVDPVPHAQVVSLIESADLSLILIQDACLSYRYCFPNKLLESIMAGLPILVSRLPELERMVRKTGAGLVVDETDPSAIAAGIASIVADPDRYRPLATTIDNLCREFGWNTQAARLLKLYASSLPQGARLT